MEQRGRIAALWAAVLGWLFDGLEMGLFPLIAGPALTELVGPDKAAQDAWKGAIYAGFLVGAAGGGLLFGWLADRVGRIKALSWSILCYALCSGLSAGVTEAWQLMLLRTLASLGMGGEWAVGLALVREVFPRGRAAFLAAMIGCAANVGILLMALLGWWMGHEAGALALKLEPLLGTDAVRFLFGADGSGWRMLFLLGALPALITFFIRRHVPESARWEDARRTSAPPRIREIFAPHQRSHTLAATGLGAVALIGMWCSVQWVPSWVNSAYALADPAARHAARSLAYVWCAVGFTLGSFAAPFVAERMGRRASFVLLTLGSVASTAWLFRTDPHDSASLHGLCLLTGTFSAGFFGWLPLALPELWPTRLRATGQGFAFNAGRILAAAGTLLSGTLSTAFDHDLGRMAAVMSLVYLVGLPLALVVRPAADLPE
jgi:MFS family permease